MEKIDVFISHAREDKQDYVYPLAKAFESLGITYWLDEIKIGWGESIVSRINEGLRESRFVLVLLTNFFVNKPWTTKELNVALHQEIDTGKLSVLPILIAARETAFEKFVLLRDKRYLEWQDDPLNIAQQLLRLLGREYKNSWTYLHPREYYGKVWIRVVRKPSTPDALYRYRIKWGPWQYENSFLFGDRSCVSLIHSKGDDQLSVPLSFEISPACYVSFGQKESPDSFVIDINKGWKWIERDIYPSLFDRLVQRVKHILNRRDA